MKSLKWLLAFLLLATAGMGSAMADHRHGGVRFGVMVGPAWGPWYPPPYYYYPPVVIERSPPVYIEQSTMPPPSQPAYWYYCPTANGYYPYVKNCPVPWQTVSPRPPG
ncbi:MAG: hypothetical protein ACM3SV_00250 [Betaproteobacteria bacterium]